MVAGRAAMAGRRLARSQASSSDCAPKVRQNDRFLRSSDLYAM